MNSAPSPLSSLLSPPSSPDALLLLSFGGPEGMEDVMPFVENVVRGKNVPQERLLEVARHYEMFDGVSPLNSENRALLTAIIGELNAHGPQMPVYWGNRHWHPMLADTVRQMAQDGVRHALAFVPSAFGSHSSCRQYLEDIEQARQAIGPEAPAIEKLRLFYNHPGFIESMADRVAVAWREVPDERRAEARIVFTAHSIPLSMAQCSPYEHQLRETCRLVVEGLSQRQPPSPPAPLPKGEGREESPSPPASLPLAGEGSFWDLAYQSRSGPPTQPWLEPDLGDHLRRLKNSQNVRDVVVVPLGFPAENMEVVYDLDVEVRSLCDELEINMIRAEVVGCHSRFIRMIRELVSERIDPAAPRLALGNDGPWPDRCPDSCCSPTERASG